MNTLSHLIEDATERFEKEFYWQQENMQGEIYLALQPRLKLEDFKDFLKTELETIVKESFKNTRVEERKIPDTKIEELTETGKISRSYKVGFNEATLQKHNKENQFLNN